MCHAITTIDGPCVPKVVRLGVPLLLFSLLNTVQPISAQQVRTTNQVSYGFFHTWSSVVSTEITVGPNNAAVGAGVSYTRKVAYGRPWSDLHKEVDRRLTRSVGGDLQLRIPVLWGLPGTIALKGQMHDRGKDPGTFDDQQGSVSFQMPLPLGQDVVVIPVVSYTFGSVLPGGTLIGQWTVNQQLTLQATALPPSVTLRYSPSESLTFGSGMTYQTSSARFFNHDRLEYERLRLFHNIAIAPTKWLRLNVEAALAFLERIRVSSSEADVTEQNHGPSPSVTVGLTFLVP